jgi:hypothetical protein
MNPAVLGALIGAVPGTVAAALATWASVRTAKLTAEQAQSAQATEHANWLRDRRSELYVEGIRFLHEASVVRARLIRAGIPAAALRDEAERILQAYAEPEWHDRIARAEAYAPDDASDAYIAAAEGDWHIWRSVRETIEADGEAELAMTDELLERLRTVGQATNRFRDLARRDLMQPYRADIAADAAAMTGRVV